MTTLTEKLRGIIVPLVTPFTADGRVDEESLRNLVDYVVNGGVNGIFVMGTTGEFQYLKFEQQRSAIAAVVDAVGDRMPVAAGVTGKSVEETTRNVIEIGSLPAPPHALVIAPLFYHSNRHLCRHIERLSRLSKIPILLYNNIGIVTRRWKRKDIIPDLVGQMALLPKVMGIKDSSGNRGYFTQLLGYRSSDFKVFQGDEVLLLEALKQGAAGAVSSMANIYPRLLVAAYEAFDKGQTKAAEACQRAINQIDGLYPDSLSVPPILKAVLARQQIIANPMSYCPIAGDADTIPERFALKIQALKQQGF
jgi:dihydrodipicolinate synthase/N-acetylneuraminate lyase